MYAIMGGEVSQPQYSQPHYYHGLSAADLGVEVNGGTIIDATIINAPSSTKNAE